MEIVTLKHPVTGEVAEVEARPEVLTPLMVKGFQQVKQPEPPVRDGEK